MIKQGWHKDAMYTFYLDGYPIIMILDNTYHGIKSFSAVIKSYGGSDKYAGIHVSDCDLNVLMLKSVLKAREIGWDIKQL